MLSRGRGRGNIYLGPMPLVVEGYGIGCQVEVQDSVCNADISDGWKVSGEAQSLHKSNDPMESPLTDLQGQRGQNGFLPHHSERACEVSFNNDLHSDNLLIRFGMYGPILCLVAYFSCPKLQNPGM